MSKTDSEHTLSFYLNGLTAMKHSPIGQKNWRKRAFLKKARAKVKPKD